MSEDFRFPTGEYEQCSADGCNHPTPWDMDNIGINQNTIVCSVDCAHIWLEGKEKPETITVRDPQYHLERPENVPDKSVNMIRNVWDDEEVTEVLSEIREMMQ